MNKILRVFLIGILIVSSIGFCACNKTLDDYKIGAKEQITSYVEKSNYNIENSDFVIKVLNDCIWLINQANSKEEVNSAVEETKNKIDNATTLKNSKAIPFKNQSYSNKVIDNGIIEGNIVLRSYAELENFFANYHVVQDEKFILDQYNKSFFNSNALVFCFYWTTDARIKRQIANVYAEEEKLQVEIINTFPDKIIEQDGMLAVNDDCYFNFNVLVVQKADIDNITEVTIIHKFQRNK